MDAPDQDRDAWVQKSSATLLADFETSLKPFLWKNYGTSSKDIRRRVRVKETDRLIALLEPFQELPQLLDPHLADFVTLLSNALLAVLQSDLPSTTPHTRISIPLSTAICKLLYTLCKIRGDKVIVRFLSTETRYLEFLLDAIEEAGGNNTEDVEAAEPWTWEERYITLLWLSQLLLAPFDLATISSESADAPAEIPGLSWPANVPTITSRLIPLAIQYLSASGKERDAAKVLLVRLAVRKDMQEISIFHALVEWADSYLQSSFRTATAEGNIYTHIGILSFLTGLLISGAKTTDMDPYISIIGQYLLDDVVNSDIASSVVARKMTIKAVRALSVLFLRPSFSISGPHEFVVSSFDYLLRALADPATPVRLAASKALSIIILNIDIGLADQCIDEVVSMFNANVKSGANTDLLGVSQDLTNVSPAEWHGLILTMAQLLYRRVPPSGSFHSILSPLLLGLSFEQRTTTGSSIGTNVRDAACFGIWSLARRYTTDELSHNLNHWIGISESGWQGAALHDKEDNKAIQIFATELVISSTVDPAGNIRRGSSAALQELIGRHPNTITEAISLVQVVDYHAVALRSRAITDVAFRAAKLSNLYMNGILSALLGWRGIGDADADSRRTAASTFGNILCNVADSKQRLDILRKLHTRIEALQPRDEDKRHGLILCVASVLVHGGSLELDHTKDLFLKLRDIMAFILKDATATHRRMDLIAEAVSRLIEAAAALTLATLRKDSWIEPLLTKEMIFEANNLFTIWLLRNEPEVIDAASEAASKVLEIMRNNRERQESILSEWISTMLSRRSGSQGRQNIGLIAALFKSFRIVPFMRLQIIKAIRDRWYHEYSIEIRAAILKHLTASTALETNAVDFANLISEGLDDYTTNARGDVGSLVRIEAVKAAGAVWAVLPQHPENSGVFMKLYGKGLRLAAEKLDKVRSAAYQAIAGLLAYAELRDYITTSQEYFRFLLEMQTTDYMLPGFKPERQDHFCREMLEGFVGSADTGSESLVRASRAALSDYCEAGNADLITMTLIKLVKENITNDRVLVPALEVLAYLFDADIIQRSNINYKPLYLTVHKAHYKTSNIRKLEASVRLYGAMSDASPEALDRLSKMVLHPFPRIRSAAVDTLFVTTGYGKGVDWLKAGKGDLAKLREQLGIPVR